MYESWSQNFIKCCCRIVVGMFRKCKWKTRSVANSWILVTRQVFKCSAPFWRHWSTSRKIIKRNFSSSISDFSKTGNDSLLSQSGNLSLILSLKTSHSLSVWKPLTHCQSGNLLLILSLETSYSFSVWKPLTHSQSENLSLILSLETSYSFSVWKYLTHCQSENLSLIVSLKTSHSLSVWKPLTHCQSENLSLIVSLEASNSIIVW